MKTSKPGKSVYLQIGIWLNEKTGNIHITGDGVHGFHTWVSNDPTSIRNHKNLFGKLAAVLKDAGAPYPNVAPDGAADDA